MQKYFQSHLTGTTVTNNAAVTHFNYLRLVVLLIIINKQYELNFLLLATL